MKHLAGLRDTYWYVPARYLRAYQRSSGSTKMVTAQTVWHFTHAGDGYLLGCSYRSIDGGAWSTSSIAGTVAPDNHVVLGFYGRIVTVGQGSLVRSHGRRFFLMQVAGGPAKTGVVHRAYMAKARPKSHAWNDLPGANGQSIPSADTGC